MTIIVSVEKYSTDRFPFLSIFVRVTLTILNLLVRFFVPQLFLYYVIAPKDYRVVFLKCCKDY